MAKPEVATDEELETEYRRPQRQKGFGANGHPHFYEGLRNCYELGRAHAEQEHQKQLEVIEEKLRELLAH
jgi:hypothetical protein